MTTVRTESDAETPAGASRGSRTAPPPTPARRKPGTVGAGRGRASAALAESQVSPTPAVSTSTDRDPADASGAPAPVTPRAPRPARPGARASGDGRRGRDRLPWTLAVIGLAGTLIFGGAWLSARGDRGGASPAQAATTKAVKASAERFSLALTNFDGATIDRDFDRLVGLSTGEFQDQADQFFSAKTRKALKEAQASSRGEIRSAYVQSVSGDRASVFVVLDQTIANNKSPQPQADTLRMELRLRKTAKGWQVATVDVLQAPAEALSGGGAGSGSSGN